jgi:chaperonin GroES
VLGPDPDGTKAARAERIGQHMTWQLLFRMAGWEEETDRLLLMLPITGCVFRKTYYDSIANANCSEMVSGEDFIINYWAKSLETAPRYTHVLRYYPYEVQEKIAAGIWLPVRVDHDDADRGRRRAGRVLRAAPDDGPGWRRLSRAVCRHHHQAGRGGTDSALLRG